MCVPADLLVIGWGEGVGDRVLVDGTMGAAPFVDGTVGTAPVVDGTLGDITVTGMGGLQTPVKNSEVLKQPVVGGCSYVREHTHNFNTLKCKVLRNKKIGVLALYTPC